MRQNTVGALSLATPSTETARVYDSSVSALSSSEPDATTTSSVAFCTERSLDSAGSGDVGIVGASPAAPSASSRRSMAPFRMADLDAVVAARFLFAIPRLAVPFVKTLGRGHGVSSGLW